MLMDTAVSRPANMSVTPAARTSGHAVGAGISISKALRSDGTGCVVNAVPSAPDHVDDREDDEPDPVYEVPVERKHTHAGRVLPADVADDRHQDQAHDDVERVQADQRVVRGPEQVRGNR